MTAAGVSEVTRLCFTLLLCCTLLGRCDAVPILAVEQSTVAMPWIASADPIPNGGSVRNVCICACSQAVVRVSRSRAASALTCASSVSMRLQVFIDCQTWASVTTFGFDIVNSGDATLNLVSAPLFLVNGSTLAEHSISAPMPMVFAGQRMAVSMKFYRARVGRQTVTVAFRTDAPAATEFAFNLVMNFTNGACV
jgi:hypothetical protein